VKERPIQEKFTTAMNAAEKRIAKHHSADATGTEGEDFEPYMQMAFQYQQFKDGKESERKGGTKKRKEQRARQTGVTGGRPPLGAPGQAERDSADPERNGWNFTRGVTVDDEENLAILEADSVNDTPTNQPPNHITPKISRRVPKRQRRNPSQDVEATANTNTDPPANAGAGPRRRRWKPHGGLDWFSEERASQQLIAVGFHHMAIANTRGDFVVAYKQMAYFNSELNSHLRQKEELIGQTGSYPPNLDSMIEFCQNALENFNDGMKAQHKNGRSMNCLANQFGTLWGNGDMTDGDQGN
jgi:hypothetical protein